MKQDLPDIAEPGESRVKTTLRRLVPRIEATLETAFPKRLVRLLTEFLVFGIKQAWACLFGGLLLAAIVVSAALWPQAAPLARYDFLFIYALGLQVLFLATRLERPPEAFVILIFHGIGTLMELFKTSAGSWTYPGEGVLRLGDVPLFSGFMYAAVGSYLARATRTFESHFAGHPSRTATLVLAIAIYANFFAHHYLPDMRMALFASAVGLFWRTEVNFRVWRWRHRMPMLVAFFLVALFIWVAENVGTVTSTWLYPNQQNEWHPVSLAKMGSWYLLMLISWTLVTLVHPPQSLPPNLAEEDFGNADFADGKPGPDDWRCQPPERDQRHRQTSG